MMPKHEGPEKVTSQMPNAFAYIRVSHPEQVESGLSLEAQEQDCQRYWARLLQPKHIAWAKLIADEAVSRGRGGWPAPAAA